MIGLLGAGTALLAGFALWESRAVDPLLPPRILADRNRAGAYLSVGFAVAGMLGLFLFLTYYFQVVLEYSPVTAGLAFLPLSAAVVLSSQVIAGRLLPQLPPRLMIVPGLLVAATAMVLLPRLDAAGGFASVVLPSEILLGLGMGCVFAPAISIATARVAPREAGVAAAVVNTAQQVGGSLGVALLNTVATAGALTTRSLSPAALVHGYANAAAWAAGILLAAAALAAVLINAGPPTAPSVNPGRGSAMILVTGATGRVGSELIGRLAAHHQPVRAMTRRPEAVTALPGVEFVYGDCEDPASLDAAFDGVDRAFLMSAQITGSAEHPTHDFRPPSGPACATSSSCRSTAAAGATTRSARGTGRPKLP